MDTQQQMLIAGGTEWIFSLFVTQEEQVSRHQADPHTFEGDPETRGWDFPDNRGSQQE